MIIFILNVITVILLLSGIMLFIGKSKTSKLYCWLLLSLAMGVNILVCSLSHNWAGLMLSIIAFILNFKALRRELKEYNKKKHLLSKTDKFLKELERYCFLKKSGLYETWY